MAFTQVLKYLLLEDIVKIDIINVFCNAKFFFLKQEFQLINQIFLSLHLKISSLIEFYSTEDERIELNHD